MTGMRVILADDEPLARMRLSRLLTELGCEVVAELEDGEDLLAWLRRGEAVDAMFLDIQMPEATGLDVFAELEDPPPTVFVTTYAEHAVKAFEAAAVDYLLKPVSKDRLEKTLARIQGSPKPRSGEGPSGAARGLQRVPIRAGEGVVLMDLRKVSHFEVEDKTVWAWSGGERLETPWSSLGDVEQIFAGAGLVRIQRHLLLRPEAILGIRGIGGGRVRIRVSERMDLEVSRTASPRLKELFGLGKMDLPESE